MSYARSLFLLCLSHSLTSLTHLLLLFYKWLLFYDHVFIYGDPKFSQGIAPNVNPYLAVVLPLSQFYNCMSV